MPILRVLPFLFAFLPAFAQSGKDAAILEMNKLATIYKSFPYLSFDVNYYCSLEETPTVYIDSLKGRVKLHDTRYWYSLDSTEAVTADSFIITLFKEDKIMYIAKPSVSLQVANPVALLDSILSSDKDITCDLTEEQNERVISMDFKPGSSFKKIVYYIDRSSGLLTRVKTLVSSSQLYDPSEQAMAEEANSFSNIEVFYTNYRKDQFDEGIFDTGRYMKREGKEFVPVAPYESFKIFVGVSDL